MRKKQHIEDFQDFVDLVDFSGKALVKEHDNFLQVPCGVSQAKYASKKPKLEAMKALERKYYGWISKCKISTVKVC